MLKAVKACAPWLSWKTAGLGLLVAVGLAACLPALSIAAGAMPLLLLIACLLPCLLPLALARRTNRARAAAPAAQPDHAAHTCDCGQDACSLERSSTGG